MAAFNLMAMGQTPFEQFFHDWYGGEASVQRALGSPEAKGYTGEYFEVFTEAIKRYKATSVAMSRLRDAYLQRPKPCSLLIDETERIWEAIDMSDDWSRFDEKVSDIRLMGRVHGRRKI